MILECLGQAQASCKALDKDTDGWGALRKSLVQGRCTRASPPDLSRGFSLYFHSKSTLLKPQPPEEAEWVNFDHSLSEGHGNQTPILLGA